MKKEVNTEKIKNVFFFSERTNLKKEILGNKGFYLSEMTNLNIRVPNGFTVSTDVCRDYFNKGHKIAETIQDEIKEAMFRLENETNKNYGGIENPLFVSVRSGSVISMPGMMDTILNIGMNDVSVLGLLKETNNIYFCFNSYFRFLKQFSEIIYGIEKEFFEEFEKLFSNDFVLQRTIVFYQNLIKKFYDKFEVKMKFKFPQDPYIQLFLAIEGIFNSWNSERAILYRKRKEISDDIGTAATIQSMVFGNKGLRSATGVVFTRNPSNGEPGLYGEYIVNAQGEDLVSGSVNPDTISSMKESFPKCFDDLEFISKKLEILYKEMQDIEFTIEDEVLYFLQTRNGKQTFDASLRILHDFFEEKIITLEEIKKRINFNNISDFMLKKFDEQFPKQVIANGLAASPGCVSGKIYFTTKELLNAVARGEKTILVRLETTPWDLEGILASEGVLTSRGGMTSHAAVIAREMGKCCISGCYEIEVYNDERYFLKDGKKYFEGDVISLDGFNGTVYKGEIPVLESESNFYFKKLLSLIE